jgi:hypothetical protein
MRVHLYQKTAIAFSSTGSICLNRTSRNGYISHTRVSLTKEDRVIIPPSTVSPWRKHQLDQLEQSLLRNAQNKGETTAEVDEDDVVQPMWRAMERRVLQRKSLTAEQRGSSAKIGRKNIKLTDEDTWLQAGLYSNDSSKTSTNGDGESKS